MLKKLLAVPGFIWRRTSDAAVFAWLFPSVWIKAIAAFLLIGTAIVAFVTRASPVLWIVGLLLVCFLVLVCAVLWRALCDPDFGHPVSKSIAELADADLKRQVTKWLRAKLPKDELIQRVALFGSIVHDHFKTSDVDLIVQLGPMTKAQIGRTVRRIKSKTAKEFKETFGHNLHVKFFVADEKPGYDGFASDTKHEEIIK
jgi:predicted nucleotidyltransferase